jgi:hypothetical protein
MATTKFRGPFDPIPFAAGMEKWSHSRFRCFRECPLRFWWQYIDKKAADYTPAHLTFGGTFHEMAETYAKHCFTEKLTSDFDFGRSQARLCWGTDNELAKVFADWMERQEFDWALTVAGVDGGGGVEQWIERDLPDGMGKMRGKLDLILWNEAEERLIVRDYKTSYWAPQYDMADPPFQLLIYAWMAFGKWPVNDAAIEIEYCRTGRIDQWAAVAPMDWMGERLAADAKVIRECTDFSATPGEHCGSCAYLPSCEAASAWDGLVPTNAEEAEELARTIGGTEARLKLMRSLERAWVEENGRVIAGETGFDYWTPAYARETQGEVPEVKPERLQEFIAALGPDLREKLLSVGGEKLAKAVKKDPTLAKFVTWTAAEAKYGSRKVKPEEPVDPDAAENPYGDL